MAREKRETTRKGEEKMKLGKEGNWETETRIEPGIFNREGREVTRRRGRKR